MSRWWGGVARVGGVLLAGALFLGCKEVKIDSPQEGAVIDRSAGTTFRAQLKEVAASDAHWLLDGADVATGDTWTATGVSAGWHEVALEGREGSKVVGRDAIQVEFVGWTSLATPAHGTPRALLRHPARAESWLAIPGEGLLVVPDQGAARRLSRASGELPSDQVRALVARDDEVWAATDAGLVRVSAAGAARTFRVADGLPSDDLRALATDPQDRRLYAATPAGLAVWDGAAFAPLPGAPSQASALAVQAGEVWVGTRGAGLHRWDGTSWEACPTDADYAQDTFTALSVDPAAPRWVWCATEAHGLLRYRDGDWEEAVHFDALPLPPLGDLRLGGPVALQNGTVWLAEAGSSALFRRAPNGLWARLDGAASAPGNWRALAIDPRTGAKWLATDTRLFTLAAGAEDRSPLDLPDLITEPPGDLSVDSGSQGRRLRLRNGVQNQGRGPLEVDGRVDPATQEHQAVQILYRGESARREQLAGYFHFHSHPNHNHFHFDGFTSYQLRVVLPGGGVGPVLRQSAKVSFCLEDFTNAGSNKPQTYDCSNQGISVGWADVYAANLAGQDIPIDGIAPGEYWVTSITTGVFGELDYRNNSASTRIRLEPNDRISVLEEVWGAR